MPPAAEEPPRLSVRERIRLARRPTSPGRGLIGVLILALLVAGCHVGGQKLITRPTKHSIRAEQLLVLSDFRIPKDHELIEDLVALRRQVLDELVLPDKSDPVVMVYLFNNQLSYRQYLEATYPGLPDRRAYFVGTARELAVFTFWGDRIQEDLRHEFTHGLLHSRLKTVPLWLDEGLAEYFEVTGTHSGPINPEYAQRLGLALANGWRPDIERLERLEEFSQMQRFDYQEAWAWVHFMLHSTPEAREALLSYLHDLQTNPNPIALSSRLEREMPAFQSRFIAYLSTLQSPAVRVGAL